MSIMGTPDFSDYTYIVPKMPLEKQNTAIVEGKQDKPWYRDGLIIGSYMPTSTPAQLPGLEMIENSIINHNKLRQLAPGQIDQEGRDISGFYVVSDVGGVWLFKDAKASYKWAKSITRSVAPSIAWIPSGHDMVIYAHDFVKNELCSQQ